MQHTREIPVVGKFDLVVCGGGAAGTVGHFSAAGCGGEKRRSQKGAAGPGPCAGGTCGGHGGDGFRF